MSRRAFENQLRAPWEWLVALVATGFGSLCLVHAQWLGLDSSLSPVVAAPFFGLALWRGVQGWRILAFRRHLLVLKPFQLGTNEIPHSKTFIYLGRGFRWLPIHRQRLHLLSLVENQGYCQKNALYRWVQARATENAHSVCAWLTRQAYLPFRPLPPIGGKPWLHGVGVDKERDVYAQQANRNSHECVFGMTRVGKTRYLCIRVNQDIRNGEAVLIIDPKGDLEAIQDVYCAAKAAGRLNDLRIVHLGFPDSSAKYNPLASFSNVSEVAGRITGAMSASGEGQAFKDFAWQYTNIVARCLHELGEPINYKTIGFYIKQPQLLLYTYVERRFPLIEPGYLSEVQAILDQYNSRTDKEGNLLPPISRKLAVQLYIRHYIDRVSVSPQVKQFMDAIIMPLDNAANLDKDYYDKITASVGPVFDKINQTQAHPIFSWENGFGLPEVRLEDIIKRRQIVYIGLDSLTNKEVAEAVGQATIADLVSLCGRLYNESGQTPMTLNLYCDEFSDIVREEFITLLNKAGGTGIRVTALTQTLNDLGAAFSSHDKPKMLLGNFGTLTTLRVNNEDTATNLTRCLELIRTRSSTPSTMSNDRSDSENGELFTTYNTDTVSETPSALVEVNDLYSLPKGQAFVLTNGGEVYKIRIPLPKNDGSAPSSFEALLSEVNL